MNWSDERYVRLYTRDTADWLALSFDAQALLGLLLRKADRTGRIACGKHGKRAAAIVIGHAREWSRLEPALEELLVDGVIDFDGETIAFRNFVDAQEAKASDRKRQQDSRDKRGVTNGHATTAPVTRDDAGSQSVTHRDDGSQNVTERHEGSHGVTPSLAFPSLAVPSQEIPAAVADGPRSSNKPSKSPPANRTEAGAPTGKPVRKQTPVQIDGDAWLAKALELTRTPLPAADSKEGKRFASRFWGDYTKAHAAFGAKTLLDSLDGHARDPRRFRLLQGIPHLLTTPAIQAGVSAAASSSTARLAPYDPATTVYDPMTPARWAAMGVSPEDLVPLEGP